ncbi:MAG: polyprenyl synthetase family protein [Chthoniobacterales bacterium]
MKNSSRSLNPSTPQSLNCLSLFLKERRKFIDKALQRALPAVTVKPVILHQAMRYSLFAGGKRLRPILCLAAAEASAVVRRNSGRAEILGKTLPVACALECLHTYSLIHDDLPSMDNDDLRRGKPTAHKVFGEGIAILSGDALLTKSFELLAQASTTPRYPLKSFLEEMAKAAGSRQLIAGQVADLQAEGKKMEKVRVEDVRFIHERKTSAIIVTALRLGAMSANASAAKLAALTEFGLALGLAFQIIDDILDVTQSSAQLGKSAKKDLAAQKATYPAAIGLAASQKKAAELTIAADEALHPLGAQGEMLRLIAKYLLERTF